MKFTTVNVHVI